MTEKRGGTISVLIVDDHQMSALGTRAMLMPDDSISIAGIARNGAEALEMLSNRHVDIVLLDILMPKMDGFETLKAIKERHRGMKVIMLTGCEDKDTIARAVAMKAEGFLFKDVLLDDLIKAVHRVYEGDYHYHKKVFDVILSEMVNYSKGSHSAIANHDRVAAEETESIDEAELNAIVARLTQREIEVLKMVGRGMSTKEISESLKISKFTVSTYRKNIYSKLEIQNLTALMGLARKFTEVS